jgi:apolipoprotein N-acyltransferase
MRATGPLVSVLAGVAQAASFAPLESPALQLLALALFLTLAIEARSPRSAALLGWCFGLGWLGWGLSWITISLHEFGDMPALLADASVGLLAAGLALLYALALAAATAAAPARSLARALALVTAWTLAEWVRGFVLGGMPWLAIGYAHVSGPLRGYAPVLGVYGVGAVAAAVAAALAMAGLRLPGVAKLAAGEWTTGPLVTEGLAKGMGLKGRLRGAAVPLALAAGLALLGEALAAHAWTHPQGPALAVRLVQGNIPQDEKFSSGGLSRSAARYLPAIRTAPGAGAPASQGPTPGLIVLPESAFPLPVGELPDDILGALADSGARGGAALIFGAFVTEAGEHIYNSAVGLDGQDPVPRRYSKRHLVPFGEYVPWGFHGFMRWLHIPIGDQDAGAAGQAPMTLAGQRIAVNICFESLFGELLRDAWRDPQAAPTLVLNLSNLAWFHGSDALAQHLQIGRMRALETGRPLLQATNTGATALVDPDGRVRARLPADETAALDVSVRGHAGDTPFLRWGDTPVVVAAALLLALAAARSRAPWPPRRDDQELEAK